MKIQLSKELIVEIEKRYLKLKPKTADMLDRLLRECGIGFLSAQDENSRNGWKLRIDKNTGDAE